VILRPRYRRALTCLDEKQLISVVVLQQAVAGKHCIVHQNLGLRELNLATADVLHSIHEAISLPLWAQILALVVVAFSPLAVVKWRKKGTWHRSEK
jgi:hypothetical protein